MRDDGRAVKNATEQTPLLDGAAEAAPINERVGQVQRGSDENADGEDKPLPVWQIVALCYARWVEPVAFFSIVPYINRMCQENGRLAEADVGFYSGLIESLFSLTQMLVMVLWGRAADRFGRKPILVLSLVGVSSAVALFGMAKTIWQTILFRCLAGVFAGTIVTIRTMISEHSTPKTQARAFAWFAFAGNLGILFGPLIGGLLADLAGQYPSLFGGIRFLHDYPYALASFAVSAIGFSAVAVAVLFIEETLPKSLAAGGRRTAAAAAAAEGSAASKPDGPSIWDLLRSPGVPIVLLTYWVLAVLAHSYTAIAPVFWYTPVDLGGYGFNPLQISLILGLNGFAQAVWILLVFPPLQRRIGTNGVLNLCSMCYPFFFAICPLPNLLLRADTSASRAAFWILTPILQGVGSGVSMSFTAIQLSINDVSPSPLTLGTLNAVALSITSGTRAFAPALFSALFAVGARTQLLWGYAIWVLMIAVSLVFTGISRFMPDYDELRRQREAAAAERETVS
ncbi:hypothetical protein VTH06DRAFT_8188 [Thermothelomyces fergusii]